MLAWLERTARDLCVLVFVFIGLGLTYAGEALIHVGAWFADVDLNEQDFD